MDNNFFHYISPTKDLYIYGSNYNHSLGLDDEHKYVSFENKIWLSSNVKKVSFGLSHTAFVTFDGNLYVVGDNSHNQIGIISRYTSTPLKIKSDIYDVMCNDNSTVYITNDGVIGEYGNLNELKYSTNQYMLKKLTPYERYDFIAIGKRLRVIGLYNIFDKTQRFMLEGDYEVYNQLGYSLVEFFNKFKPHTIKKVIICDEELFVLDINNNLYYYGKYMYEMRCSNSGTIIMTNVEDIVKSRSGEKLYMMKRVNNKDYILSRDMTRGRKC